MVYYNYYLIQLYNALDTYGFEKGGDLNFQFSMGLTAVKRQVKDFYLDNDLMYMLSRQNNFFIREPVYDVYKSKCTDGYVISYFKY